MEKQIVVRNRVAKKSPKEFEEAMKVAKSGTEKRTTLKSGIRIKRLKNALILF